MAQVEKQSSAPSGEKTPYEITANLIVDNLNAALKKIIDSLQTTPNKASRDIPAEMTAAFNKAFAEFSGVFERAIAEDNLSPESLTALARAQIMLTKIAKNMLGKVPTFQLGEPVPAVAPVTARPVVAERQISPPAPPEKRKPALSPSVFGRDQLKSPYHECQDRTGSKYENGKLRIVVADGSGGSLSDRGLSQPIQDQMIGNKMGKYVSETLSDMQSTPDKAHLAGARKAYELTRTGDNPSYGVSAVVDVSPEKGIEYAGPGDVGVVLYGGPTHFFDTRRTETPRDNGKRSPFQLINKIDNQAHHLRFVTGADSVSTARLDSSGYANEVRAVFGEEPPNEADAPLRSVSVAELKRRGAKFALVMTDGAQPSSMIDCDVDENRVAAEQLLALVRTGRREPLPLKYGYLRGTDPATRQPYNLAAEAQGIIKQTRYYLEVKSAMDTLSNGAITAAEAAQRIVHAARNILEDSDDITVRIIDLRAVIPALR